MTAHYRTNEAEPRILLHLFLCILIKPKGIPFASLSTYVSATLTLFEQVVENSSNRIRLSALRETICLDGSTLSFVMPRE